MVHLGMSGSLQMKHPPFERLRHDHVLLTLGSGAVLVFNDPRRFGSMHWLGSAPEDHRLLAHLGPEPLSPAFDGTYLAAQAKGRSAPVKAFLMDGSVVVGVGNIYATEALFLAGIHPRRPARRISAARYDRLATEVRPCSPRPLPRGAPPFGISLMARGARATFSRPCTPMVGRPAVPPLYNTLKGGVRPAGDGVLSPLPTLAAVLGP